jgi:hypothetical protein
MGAAQGEELARVEGHEHRVEGRGGGLAGAAAGGGDGALADGLGVAGGHAQPVSLKGLAQRWPAGAQLGRGGIHATQPLGELEGTFGLGPVGQEPAGLPAHPAAEHARRHCRRRRWFDQRSAAG